uniref:NADH dehydrogenase subunit 2 n=1 Tax=Lopaphus sphalerus TaxID=202369 RepID=UPI0025A96D06|nr:NADH dehydrogenase subunit 2 [Lopaphus sphalerus]WID87055.1 NADH dehydrogenase subunit 2 [Lopaphus sphalerus]
MMNKSTNIMSLIMLMMSIMISVSANSWFTVWMGMEMNIMSFMPLIMEQKNLMSKESALTYFMVQTIASMILMMSMILMSTNNNSLNLNMEGMSYLMMISSLMMKSAMSPFHWWMPKMMEGLSWNKCFILMTIQKIIPMMLMSSIIDINIITLMAMSLSIIVGAIGGLNQTSLRKLMAYSSITNNGWMLLAMMISEMMWMIYFCLYSIMTFVMTSSMSNFNNYHINQVISMNESNMKKFFMMMNMLSISGLPPMMGFMPKWLVMQSNMTKDELFLVALMVMFTLITIYYYLRITFSTMLLSNNETKWNNKISTKMNKMTTMMNTLSITGMLMITMTINMF